LKANNTPAWVSDENLLKKQIYDLLKPYVSTGMPKKSVESSGGAVPKICLCRQTVSK